MKTCRLPERLVKTLVNQGYAFLLPPVDAAKGKAPAKLEHMLADARRLSDEAVADA
jgi:hypothetical protein